MAIVSIQKPVMLAFVKWISLQSLSQFGQLNEFKDMNEFLVLLQLYNIELVTS